ncbi:hypothetical protein C3L33_18354, partial [Rhododendron williamsianum]
MSSWWRTAAGDGLRRAARVMRSYHTIQAIPRELKGNRVSARDRAQGRIPAVVFTQSYLQSNPSSSSRPVSRKRLLTTEKKQIQAILDSVQLPFFCSTTFPLQIRAGSGSSSFLESGNIHRDQETGKILNLVFVWADEGTELKVDVPVVFNGEEACPGLQKAEHIPSKIEVDVSNLDIGDKVFMQDIKVHSSLKLLSKNESIPICKVAATNLDQSELPGS